MSNIDSIEILQNSTYLKHILNLSNLFARTPLKMVENGDRDATTIHIQKLHINSKINELEKLNLCYTHLYWTKKKEGFSHVLDSTKGTDPNDISYGVVTRSSALGEDFKHNLLKNNEIIIGKYLGFPDCCSKFYQNHWSSKNFDLVWNQALNSEGLLEPLFVENRKIGLNKTIVGTPECVSFYRYWGPRLCFHIPCSFNCKESKKVALKHLEYLQLLTSKEFTSDYHQFFTQQSYWYSKNGVSITQNLYMKGTGIYPRSNDLLSIQFKAID